MSSNVHPTRVGVNALTVNGKLAVNGSAVNGSGVNGSGVNVNARGPRANPGGSVLTAKEALAVNELLAVNGSGPRKDL